MTPRLLQMYSLRAQIDALIAGEEADLGMVQPQAEGCQHPEDKRVSTTTLGSEQSFRCLACGQDVKGQA